LALGLKKETADMYYRFYDKNTYEINPTWETIWEDRNDYKKIIPAWSLHRLIELKEPNTIDNALVILSRKQTYDKLIGIIAKSIKDGHFNKDFLEE
jgi:hypothetical protein